jgi:hypothetical protein
MARYILAYGFYFNIHRLVLRIMFMFVWNWGAFLFFLPITSSSINAATKMAIYTILYSGNKEFNKPSTRSNASVVIALFWLTGLWKKWLTEKEK